MITYTEEKQFTQEQVVALFQKVGWHSAEYPTRLYKALMNLSTVITAWDGDRLAGLARALDDTELVAYLKYILVDPDESKNAPFYAKHGSTILEDGVAIEIWNQSEELKY